MQKILTMLLVTGVLLLFAGCLRVPAQDLPETVDPVQLADSESQFLEVRGLQLHYKKDGGGDPVFLLLHGFSASVYTWQEVMTLLAAQGSVLAYDRPAFGPMERPLEWQE